MASDPIPELRTSLKAETDGDFRGPLRALRARLQEETDSQFAAVPAVVRNPIDGTGTAQQKPAEPLMAPSPHLTAPMAQRSNPVLTWFDSWIRTVLTGAVAGALIGSAWRWLLH